MTGREKVIVVAAGVAVVWGAATFLWDRVASGRDTLGPEIVESAQAFRTVAESQLQVVRVTASERNVLKAVGAPWEADMFQRAELPADPGEEKFVRQQHLYTGYAVLGDVRFAVINGRVYRLEDTLENDVAVLAEITPAYVLLRFPHDESMAIIPFEGLERERK